MRTGTVTIRRRRFAGFSVLEVLVVLVVLLIGILAIARLFPGGFLTIQRTGERTGAGALVAQQIEAQKNSDSIPEAILALDNNDNPLPNVHPDELDRPAGVPAALDYFYSGPNIFRSIRGEVVRIPIATPNPDNGALGATYLLQNGPALATSIQVYGQPMERIEQSSASAGAFSPPSMPNVLNDSQYAIDYEAQRIGFYPRPINGARPDNVRRFYMQLDYFADDGNGGVVVRSLLNHEVVVPDVDPQGDLANLRPLWQPIFANAGQIPTGFLRFKPSSDEVSRRFRNVMTLPVLNRDGSNNGAPVWTDDPYEYAVYSPQEVNGATIGVLLFNPAGRTVTVRTSTGTRPFTARVDYRVFDNFIIREDRQVPNQPPYDIKLSLPFILTQGDALENQNTYNGIFCADGADPNLPMSPSILIYNANTGFPSGNLTGRCDPNVPTNQGRVRFTLEPRTGTVRLVTQDVENNGLRSANLRFYYRVQKNWAMQLQKAQARYFPAEAPNQMNFRSYYVGGSVANVGRPTRLYFPRSESGKTVILGEYWVRTNLSGSDQFKRFSGESYQIANDPSLFDDVGLPYIDLRTLHPEAGTQAWAFTAAQTGQYLSSVQGASVKARVFWRDAGRWRKTENETILLPNQLR